MTFSTRKWSIRCYFNEQFLNGLYIILRLPVISRPIKSVTSINLAVNKRNHEREVFRKINNGIAIKVFMASRNAEEVKCGGNAYSHFTLLLDRTWPLQNLPWLMHTVFVENENPIWHLSQTNSSEINAVALIHPGKHSIRVVFDYTGSKFCGCYETKTR